MLAGPQGLEPRLTDPKSDVLPLDEGPIGKANKSLSKLVKVCQGKKAHENG
jgi:hypothetical protein